MGVDRAVQAVTHGENMPEQHSGEAVGFYEQLREQDRGPNFGRRLRSRLEVTQPDPGAQEVPAQEEARESEEE
jgi:hypothetical protein